ncbi:MAG: hypothetical protein ABR552_05975 [Actinomycetota bacterium]|nr:hypothetical protein [Actinomycetota bacterium]
MKDVEDIRPWWVKSPWLSVQVRVWKVRFKRQPWMTIALAVLLLWAVIAAVSSIVGAMLQAVTPIVIIALVTYIVMHNRKHHSS